MKWLPSLGRRLETKGGIDRRHSAGPYYAAPGVPYEQPLRDLDVDRAVSEAWAADVWVYRTVHARATNASRIEVQIKAGREKGARLIEDHPLSMLLNRRANKYETAQAFRYRVHTLLDLSKKGVPIEVIERRSGEIESLHILNPKWTWPIPDPDTFVSGFEMRLPSGQKFTLPPYEQGRGGVLWIKRPHPTDPYSSSSWLEATGVSIDLDRYARRYNLNFMFNDGRPGGVLMVKGEDGVDPRDAEDLSRYLSGGPGVAGRVRVMEGEGLDYVDFSTTPRDAQYVEGRAITKGEILGGGGTPESLWNASGRTFDNADAEYEGFWRNEMVPELELVGSFWEELTQGGPLDDSEVVTYAYDTVAVLQRDARNEEARAQAEFDKGLITADEYRDRTGKDPLNVAGTRVLWLAAGKAPVGAPEDVAELTGAPLPGEEPPPPELPPGGTPAALPRGSDQEQPPTMGEEILDAEIVEEAKVLDEVEYAAKALGSLPKELVEHRRRQHAAMLDHWEAELARALAQVLERQEQVVAARLGGSKARKHTRHWDYGPGGPRHEIKALDAAYVVERMRWAEEIVRAIADVVKEAFLAAGRAALAHLGISGEPEYDDDSRRVVASTVRSIAEGFDARAGKLQQVIRDAEAQGKPLPEIADEVRSAYLSAGTWASVSSRQVVGAMNAASLMAAIQAGAVRKRWLSTDDERTRPTHVEAEGQQQEIGHRFRVGVASLAYPGDPSGPPEEVVSCRCTMLFQTGRDFEADLDEDLAALEADEAQWKRFEEGRHPRDRAGRFARTAGGLLPGSTAGEDRDAQLAGKTFLGDAGRQPGHGAVQVEFDAEQQAYIARLDLDAPEDTYTHQQMREGLRAQQAKANITAALADRLNNPDDWEMYRRYYTALRTGQGLRDRADLPWDEPRPWDETTPAERKKILDKESSNRVGVWATTSGDGNPWAVMMQRAVEEEFGTGGDWDWEGITRGEAMTNDEYESRRTIEGRWDQVREFYRRFARVMYENTQDELAAAGVTEVTVRRGMTSGDSGYDWERVGEHPVTLQPTNSWSSRTGEAARFAQDLDSSDGRILTATFPAARIIASARTGWGSLDEQEFVVLNGPGNVAVEDYDTFIRRRSVAARADWAERETARRAAVRAAAGLPPESGS